MIQVITGLPGFGKTTTLARWGYFKGIKKGKKVYANFPLQGAEYYHDIAEVLGVVQNALILVDEMGIVFDQLKMYELEAKRPGIWMECRQHRKDAVDIMGTAQSILDIAYPMRRLIQFEYNIYFKAWRIVAVSCRNPQPRGDSYGKSLWILSKKVFKLFDTHHKVNHNLKEQYIPEDTVFARRQNDMMSEYLERKILGQDRLL